MTQVPARVKALVEGHLDHAVALAVRASKH